MKKYIFAQAIFVIMLCMPLLLQRFVVENKIVDKVCELDAQIKELKQYLPEMMPEEDVRRIISEIVASGETNKGKIIGATVKAVGNRFDKSLIPKMVAMVLGA